MTLARITKQLQIKRDISSRRQVSQLDPLETLEPVERTTVEKYTINFQAPLRLRKLEKKEFHTPDEDRREANDTVSSSKLQIMSPFAILA